jgi:hypothetical protein
MTWGVLLGGRGFLVGLGVVRLGWVRLDTCKLMLGDFFKFIQVRRPITFRWNMVLLSFYDFEFIPRRRRVSSTQVAVSVLGVVSRGCLTLSFGLIFWLRLNYFQYLSLFQKSSLAS